MSFGIQIIMANPSLTPEEKLLRIIETPGGDPGRAGAMRVQRRGMGFGFTLKMLRVKYQDRFKTVFNIKSLNVFLVFVALGLTVFLGLDFWLGMPRLGLVQKLELLAKKTEIGDFKTEPLDPLIIYAQEISQRNIFGLTEKAAEPVASKPQESPALTGLSESLKLVGIMWSEAPQAIIEDTKDSGKTYLVNRGGKIKNVHVKDILKDRVILSYDDQDIELK